MGRAVLSSIALAVALAGCGGGGGVQSRDIPTGFRDVQHSLGVMERTMDRAPQPPDSIMEIPANLRERFTRDGLFDPKVQAWARKLIRSQRALDAQRKPLFFDAIRESQNVREALTDVRAEEAISEDFARLLRDYARAFVEWVGAEGRTNGFFGDSLVVMNQAVNGHAKFLAQAQAGAFPTQADVKAAYSKRLAPLMQQLRDLQAESLEFRQQTEDAVIELNRSRQELGDYLGRDAEAAEVVGLLARDDPVGLFGYFLERSAR